MATKTNTYTPTAEEKRMAPTLSEYQWQCVELTSQTTARQKIAAALTLIERAQNDLATAAAQLSAIEHGYSVYKGIWTMHDRVKALWYRVEKFYSSGRYRLDSINRARIISTEVEVVIEVPVNR